MGTFDTSIDIAAPPDRVWTVLGDVGTIGDWHPGIVSSRLIGDQAEGLGATRYCDLGGDNYLNEEVVAWEPERRLTMRVTETNLPMEAVDIRFTLEPRAGGTHVTCSPLYRLKFGPLGELVDRLYVRRTYRRGMETLLDGLKRDVEGRG